MAEDGPEELIDAEEFLPIMAFLELVVPEKGLEECEVCWIRWEGRDFLLARDIGHLYRNDGEVKRGLLLEERAFGIVEGYMKVIMRMGWVRKFSE